MNREDLDDLYRETVLVHARHPHNFGTLPSPDREGEGTNPICGDRVGLQLALDGDRIRDARFHGSGCALSQASASMMTDAISGKSSEEAASLIEGVERMLRGEDRTEVDLGDLEGLQGVVRFPVRVRCALLAWKVLRQALATGG
ncbi:MAG TPA: SUF system NifU family Fe-S cluster assembly protein [Dehalococcoidia bacterium]|nr:SUF system NifU family Fe-S cluster assembly protein [Dehalococcoidia bacterium]